jgi:hypothetical protein
VEDVKIFISYSRKDIKRAEKIEQKLQENGFDTWRDVSDIDPGENWSCKSANSLANSDNIVLLWSEHAATSRTVKNEWLTDRTYDYTKLPPHAFIPFRQNPNFVGRHTELLDLYL